MSFSKKTDPSTPENDAYYQPLPTSCHRLPPQPQCVIILPSYYNPRPYFRGLFSKRIICISLLLLFIAVAAFFLWPSNPKVSITRLHLKHFHVRKFPVVTLDITLDLTVKVRNRDFYSIHYESLLIDVGYRGKQLGLMESHHGHVRARGSSYVMATLELEGIHVLADIIPLLEDIARGKITFDTETKIEGQLGLLFFELPLQGQVSCEIVVNTHNQTIDHQNCYPDL